VRFNGGSSIGFISVRLRSRRDPETGSELIEEDAPLTIPRESVITV